MSVLRLDDRARTAAVYEIAEYLRGVKRDELDRRFFRSHPTIPEREDRDHPSQPRETP
jgi:hypothetical protein